MARYTKANCKLCRREGEKLFLKGHRCYTTKCAFEKRGFAPGQHGQSRRFKVSNYGMQLREKQKVRRTYGILEKQFRNYFKNADAKTGVTGEILLQLLETRFDNIVYRLGFAPSRKSARQLVKHCHFTVDGKTVNVPSYQIKPGNVIKVRDKSKTLDLIHESIKEFGQTDQLGWLRLNKAALEGELLELPKRQDIPVSANEQLIVELYSK